MKPGDRVRIDPDIPQTGGLTGVLVERREQDRWVVRLDRDPLEQRVFSSGYLIPDAGGLT